MKIYSFGDSFTQGLGTDRTTEHALLGGHPKWDTMTDEQKNIQRTKVAKFWIENSFTHMLANKLECEYSNFGHNGSRNMDIVEMMMTHSHYFKKGDLVLIGWTSSLRDRIPFWPKQIKYKWIAPSQRVKNNHLLPEAKGAQNVGTSAESFLHDFKEEPNKELKNGKEIHEFFKTFTKSWLVEGYQEKYYHLYNEQLIYFVQKFLEYHGVKYIMFNAFEPMLQSESTLINYKYYWTEGKESIWSLTQHNEDLLELSGWNTFEKYTPRHPSKMGHELFTQQLYKFYNKVHK